MRVNCPTCGCKSVIRASEQLSDEVRHIYCQCTNLNCSASFRCSITFDHVIRSPEQGSSPPDPEKQPELLKYPRQVDLFVQLEGLEVHESQ